MDRGPQGGQAGELTMHGLTTRGFTMRGPVFHFPGGRSLPAYAFFLITGIILAFVWSMLLIVLAGLSPKVGLALTGSILLGCLGFALAVRVLTGNERLVFYHYLLVGSCAALGSLWLAGVPLLPYFDIVACLVAVLTGFGRIGCLLAGCCHGRPWRHGVTYTAAHAADGFPSQLVGIRLLPVQAMESAWGFVVAAVCSAAVLRAETPGTALALFGIAQPGGRFLLEFLRGDEREVELRGLTPAQWTAAAMMLTTLALARPSASPWAWPWLLLAASAGLLAIAAWARRRAHALLAPSHLFEVIDAAARARDMGVISHPQVTSRGLRITGGAADGSVHYTVSSTRAPLSTSVMMRLARLVAHASGLDRDCIVIPGRQGIFHIVLPRG
jgi:prolipoprotein diacylglyceryltransferase